MAAKRPDLFHKGLGRHASDTGMLACYVKARTVVALCWFCLVWYE